MSEILDDLQDLNPFDSQTWELASYVGEGHVYYLAQWEKIKTGSIFSFNWPAFLIGFLWMLYRKMYWEAGALWGIITIETFVAEYFFYDFFAQNPFVNLLVQITYGLITGFLGNYLYLNSATRAINRAKANALDDDALKLKLAHVGGTSWLSLVIGIVVIVTLMFFPAIFPF